MVTFLGVLLIILASFIVSDGAGPSYSSSCFESECNGVTIKYPFWKIDPTVSTVHCGYRGFGVNCSSTIMANSYPILALPNDTSSYYYVTSFDHDNRSVTLVDSDVLGQTCPRPRRNVTVGLVPLLYTSADMNLSFYFNCSADGNNIAAASTNRITCLEESDGKGSFVFTKGKEAEGFDWVGQCEEKVVVTVKESEAGAVGSVKEGFVMEWQADEGCRPCEKSGGKCGFDHRTWQTYCFCGDTTSNSKCPGTGNNITKVYIGIISGIFGILSMAIIVYCIKKRRPMLFKKQSPSSRDIEEFIRHQGSVAPNRFGYSEVKRMTNSFKDKLGQGGFGAVYKGKLPDGTLVAVKLLNSAKGNGEDFVNEVASISRTAHINIVSLLGFCFESEKRALVYEFMSNGSLDGYIKCHVSTPVAADVRLEWEKLYQIAIGVARGLEYLHHGCSTRILHLDIKPQNILLDNEFRPKISDFGLSKLCLGRESVVTSLRARGTIGYIAPEVLNRNYGGVSHKSDVHSYGMMLIEMVGGTNDIDVEADDSSEIYFYDEVYRLVEPGRSLGFNDPLTANNKDTEIARKMALVGIWCIQADPRQRLSISKVIEMLEGSTEALPVPPKPSYFSPMRSSTVSSSMLGSR